MSNNDRVQLGSFRVWLIARIAQIVFPILLIGALTGTKFVTQYWPIALFLVILVVLSFDATEPLAYGYGNEQGIYYRRYIKMQFMPWENIDSVECTRLQFCRIIVHFNRGNFFYRRIVIAENPKVRDFFAQIIGRELPKTVIWIRSHLKGP